MIPKTPTAALLVPRLTFLAEEFFETLESAGCPPDVIGRAKNLVAMCIRLVNPERFDMVGFADGHLDTIYFAVGTLDAIGVDGEPLFDRVHDANMRKLWSDGLPRYQLQTGKILKPPEWTPPDIRTGLIEQGWEDFKPQASEDFEPTAALGAREMRDDE
jgi:predicted HAD superfamily Cof-like phosphohydrolase